MTNPDAVEARQPAPAEVCQTCGIDGFIIPVGGPPIPCPDCNGTGKEGG